jgi:hypothetical protein
MNEFDLSKISFSHIDRKKAVTIPQKLTADLAEDLGIHIGDGSMYTSGPTNRSYVIRCSGNAVNDREHYLTRIIPLKEKLFGIRISGKIMNFRENEFGFAICSKAIYQFYSQVIGIPSGHKARIAEIPKIIFDADESTKAAFIRWLVDTDFSLSFKGKSTKHNRHCYPVISANFASKKLTENIKELLSDMGFSIVLLQGTIKRYEKRYPSFKIDINGRKNLEKWISVIGFNNPKHITKYLVWKRFGFCPPRTTIHQRKDMLNGKVDPRSYY